MNRKEKIIFFAGMSLLGLYFGFLIWPMLLLLAWYIRRIPEKRLFLTDRLATNQRKFYSWLADTLKVWLKYSIIAAVAPVVGGVFLFLIGCLFLYLAGINPQDFWARRLRGFSLPIGLGIHGGWMTAYPFTLIGYFLLQRLRIKPMFDFAETSARLLVGNEAYDNLTEEDKNKVKRNVVDSQIGINKATLLVKGGQVQALNEPAGDLQRWGGTGVLVVQEGHVVALEQSGRVSRIVGEGVTHLQAFERISMVVPLTSRSESPEITNVVTRDQIVIPSIKLYVSHKADAGNKNTPNGRYPYDKELILNKIWSPRGGDWRDSISRVAETATRNIAARHTLNEIIVAMVESPQELRAEIREAINKVTKTGMGIETTKVEIGEITIPETAQKEMLNRVLCQIKRRTKAIDAESEFDAKVTQADAARYVEIVKAEGESTAEVTRAKGTRQATMLKAEGEGQAKIFVSEGEKKAMVTLADAEKEATITKAEGENQATITKIEGDKQRLIAMAEGEKQATITRAEGKKQAMLTESAGERETKKAMADLELELANTEMQARIIEGAGEKGYQILVGEGKADAISREEFARAEGAAERIRQMMAALYQRHVDPDKAFDMLSSVLRDAELRRIRSMMMLEQGMLREEDQLERAKTQEGNGSGKKGESDGGSEPVTA